MKEADKMHVERTGIRLASLALATLMALLRPPANADEDAKFFDPKTGYRTEHYRSPVPGIVPGGTRIDAVELKRLLADENAILLDVAPAEGGGPDPSTGQWRLLKPREDIPGSVWLPNTGKGVIPTEMDRYFRGELERLTAGSKSRAIIIYCLSDCWMGWNAVQRAASYGYTKLYWYPEGTDGWRDWDGTLVTARPLPLTPATSK